MSFRVKLRIKQLKSNPDLLSRLVEAAQRDAVRRPNRYQELYDQAKLWPDGNQCVPVDDWVRRFGHGNLPYRGPNTCFLWNGIAPINGGVQ
jgi:hypothetical protein